MCSRLFVRGASSLQPSQGMHMQAKVFPAFQAANPQGSSQAQADNVDRAVLRMGQSTQAMHIRSTSTPPPFAILSSASYASAASQQTSSKVSHASLPFLHISVCLQSSLGNTGVQAAQILGCSAAAQRMSLLTQTTHLHYGNSSTSQLIAVFTMLPGA